MWKTSKARLVTAKAMEGAVKAKTAATQSNGTNTGTLRSERGCDLEEPINYMKVAYRYLVYLVSLLIGVNL